MLFESQNIFARKMCVGFQIIFFNSVWMFIYWQMIAYFTLCPLRTHVGSSTMQLTTIIVVGHLTDKHLGRMIDQQTFGRQTTVCRPKIWVPLIIEIILNAFTPHFQLF